MKIQQYLTFHCHDFQYGIEAELIQEVFPLPELTSITKSTTETINSIDLRGKVVPILHLNLLQEHSISDCNLSDYIIIVQEDNLQFGIVVNQVNEVVEMSSEGIKTEFQDGLSSDVDTALIAGIYLGDPGIILLLNSQALVRQLDAVLPLIWDAQMQLDVVAAATIHEIDLTPLCPVLQQPGEHEYLHFPLQLIQEGSAEDEILDLQEELNKSYFPLHVGKELGERLTEQDADYQLQNTQIGSDFFDLYCPNATLEEKAIFRQRANHLKQLTTQLSVTNELMSLAIISLGHEYFGLNLELVRGFIDIRNITPIPCCPNHIIGNMNLRGEIVTLVDIRNVLNLPTAPVNIGSKAVVVQVNNIIAGLPVDQVLEVFDLNSADLTAAPSTLGEQYLRGMAFFDDKILKVIDLPKIFTQGELVVNEEV